VVGEPQGHRGKNVFEGGFLGLDNIGVFDRSRAADGRTIEQSDGTSWMGMYCLTCSPSRWSCRADEPGLRGHRLEVLRALRLHRQGDARPRRRGNHAWDEADGFYYDVLHTDREVRQLKVRSMVGLIPLFAVETLEPEVVERLPAHAPEP